MSWWQIVWFVISNLGNIRKIIEEIIELFSKIDGSPEKDEREPVRQVKRKLRYLAKKTAVACPSTLVTD